MKAKKRRGSNARRDLARDIFFILIGALIALALSWSGAIDGTLSFFGQNIASAFIAGIFFTSVFTIAPASIALVHIAKGLPVPDVALWGALGAVCGDLILFFFIRDRFAEDLVHSLRPSLVRRLGHSFHFGFLKWLSPLIGALIIASPIPDEFGLALMGMSKVRTAVLVPVSFTMNALGLLGIIWFAGFV